MLVTFSLIFVVDTKIVFGYKFGSPLRKELSIKLFPKISAPDITGQRDSNITLHSSLSPFLLLMM